MKDSAVADPDMPDCVLQLSGGILLCVSWANRNSFGFAIGGDKTNSELSTTHHSSLLLSIVVRLSLHYCLCMLFVRVMRDEPGFDASGCW